MSYYYGYRRRRVTQRQVLAHEYSGIDEDVRSVFLSLDASIAEQIFWDYETEFGESARRYAEKCFKDWRSGAVKMSAKISHRLLHFLPPLLDFEQKYNLISRVWKRVQPKKSIKIVVHPGIGHEKVIRAIAEAVEEKMRATIPEAIRSKLTWLSGNDAELAEALTKRVLLEESRQICNEASAQVAVILDQISRNPNLAINGNKRIDIAGTTIEVKVKKTSFLWEMFHG